MSKEKKKFSINKKLIHHHTSTELLLYDCSLSPKLFTIYSACNNRTSNRYSGSFNKKEKKRNEEYLVLFLLLIEYLKEHQE